MNDTYAFPVTMSDEGWVGGMKLRDYFAAKAMQAYITAAPRGRHVELGETLASVSYDVAELMMHERAKRGDT